MLNLIDFAETLWLSNARCLWLIRVACDDGQVVAQGRQREYLPPAGQALEATADFSFVHLRQYASVTRCRMGLGLEVNEGRRRAPNWLGGPKWTSRPRSSGRGRTERDGPLNARRAPSHPRGAPSARRVE